MVSNTNAGDAAAPQAGNQPLSGSMNPGPVISKANTQAGNHPTESSGYPIPKTVQPDRAVEGTNREIDHNAELTKETGKAFTKGKVEGEASGEKHLDSDLNKQQLPKGAAELKQVSLPGPRALCLHIIFKLRACTRSPSIATFPCPAIRLCG